VTAIDVLASGPVDGQAAIAVNLGTGVGSSVLDVIRATETVAGRPVPHEIVGRRAGDPSVTYADPTRGEEILGWRARQGLMEIVETAYRWHSKHV
jgi:UDP-glucose 4-epimerase